MTHLRKFRFRMAGLFWFGYIVGAGASHFASLGSLWVMAVLAGGFAGLPILMHWIEQTAVLTLATGALIYVSTSGTVVTIEGAT